MPSSSNSTPRAARGCGDRDHGRQVVEPAHHRWVRDDAYSGGVIAIACDEIVVSSNATMGMPASSPCSAFKKASLQTSGQDHRSAHRGGCRFGAPPRLRRGAGAVIPHPWGGDLASDKRTGKSYF